MVALNFNMQGYTFQEGFRVLIPQASLCGCDARKDPV